MIYIVDRRTWYRGHGGVSSGLLRPDGTRCCLGFAASQCGAPDGALVDTSYPCDISASARLKLPSWLTDGRTNCDSLKAAQINDTTRIPDSVRELKLREIAQFYGDDFEFIN